MRSGFVPTTVSSSLRLMLILLVGLTYVTMSQIYTVAATKKLRSDDGKPGVQLQDYSIGIITTFAGTGTVGFSGDGGPATSASFSFTNGIASDGAGYMYIADRWNYRIRRVTQATGIITTYAGNGTAGYGGDGGAASSASMKQTFAIAFDISGNAFIADGGNNRIRRVSKATGIIRTFAGTGSAGYDGDGAAATSASLNVPWGVAVGGSGNVFIADSVNNRVRVVMKATGIITTYAGNDHIGYGFAGDNVAATSASLSYPSGVALDGAGNLYIADQNNKRIRLVSKATGVITTFAGTGAETTDGDGGSASSASLRSPIGLAVDSSGNVFIAGIDRIRFVSKATGIISTFAGGGSSWRDNGPATSAYLNYPFGVALDGSGNVFIADPYSNVIRVVSPPCSPGTARTSGGSPCTVCSAGTYSAAAGATSCTACPVGLLAAAGATACAAGNKITTIAGTLGVVGSSGDGGPATSATIGYLHGVAVDVSSNVYAADWNYVQMITGSTGIIMAYAGMAFQYGTTGDGGAATSARLGSVEGLAVDVSGNLYIANSYYPNKVRVVMKATGIINTVAGTGANTADFSGDGGAATSAQLNQPMGVVLDTFGNIYISDTMNGRIRIVTKSTGIITTIAGTGIWGSSGNGGPATSAMLYHPHGLALDTSGNLFMVDNFINNVRIIAKATGIITLYAGTGTAGMSGDDDPATSAMLNGPTSIALDASNNAYIADSGNNRVRRVSAATGIITTIAGTGTAVTAARRRAPN